MKTPDISLAQIAALVTFAVGQLVAFGLLSAHSQQLDVSLGTTIVAAAWQFADAHIRNGRSKAAAIQLIEQLLNDQKAAARTP